MYLNKSLTLAVCAALSAFSSYSFSQTDSEPAIEEVVIMGVSESYANTASWLDRS